VMVSSLLPAAGFSLRRAIPRGIPIDGELSFVRSQMRTAGGAGWSPRRFLPLRVDVMESEPLGGVSGMQRARGSTFCFLKKVDELELTVLKVIFSDGVCKTVERSWLPSSSGAVSLARTGSSGFSGRPSSGDADLGVSSAEGSWVRGKVSMSSITVEDTGAEVDGVSVAVLPAAGGGEGSC